MRKALILLLALVFLLAGGASSGAKASGEGEVKEEKKEGRSFIVGEHAAVDTGEIADFFPGFLTIDIMNDDL